MSNQRKDPFDLVFAFDDIPAPKRRDYVNRDGLGPDQLAAADAFEAFRAGSATTFGLFGYAGTGKSWLTARFLETLGGEIVFACPTHKALAVGRRFLIEVGHAFEQGYDKFHHQYGVTVTGTTAALLGLRPVIVDDQTTKSREFGSVNETLVEKMGGVDWIIVDEVSMLSAPQLRQLEHMAGDIEARILVVGDPGQLPPVEAEPIDFDLLGARAVLERIMRQGDDSAIPRLAAAVRGQADWRAVKGAGVDHFENPAGAFIDELDGPPAVDERDRSVFVAYRNARVNAVQQAACMKVYGHGRLDFEAGETVTASAPLYTRSGACLCNIGDTLLVEEIGENDSGEWGTPVTMRTTAGGGFTTQFLNDVARADPGHRYNVRLRELEKHAKLLQREWLRDRGDIGLKRLRGAAWGEFFSHKDTTVVSAAHPFALTSHKAQGSTYRQAFVDARDMSGFDHRALYVGVTRPSEELIVG